jgi:hypothetical protein
LTAKTSSKGKTPWLTLGAQMYVEARDNQHSEFIKVGKRPARFFLKVRAESLPQDVVQRLGKK